jgi:hypothetical protein
MHLFLSPKIWVFHGIQVHTPAAAHDAQHGRLSVFEASVWDGSMEQVRHRGSSGLYSHVGLKSHKYALSTMLKFNNN